MNFDYSKLKKKDLINLLKITGLKLHQSQNQVRELMENGNDVSANQQKLKMEKKLKDKDKQLRLFYEQINTQKEQYESEIRLLKNHNE